MTVMVLDTGNSIIKAKIARHERSEIVFPQVLQPLTEAEYQRILSWKGNGNTLDYLRVNGQAYVVGESAERYGVITQRSGSARYSRQYYGVLAATGLRLLDFLLFTLPTNRSVQPEEHLA